MALAFVLVSGAATPRDADNPRAASRDWDRTATPAAASAPSQAVGPFFIGPRNSPEAAASAKPLSEADRLIQDMLHTDRLIRVLRAKIHRSGNPGAQDRFSAAMKREREARDAYGQSQLARASRLTFEARTLAREAAFMVGPPEEDPAYVARELDRAEDALLLAKEVFDQRASAPIWARYHGLENEQKKARQLQKSGNTRDAYRKAVGVRDAVLDLLTDASELPIPASTATKALQRVQRVMDRVVKDMGSKPGEEAARWQQEASEHIAKAKQSYARKDYRSAVIYAKLAVRILDQAVTAQRTGTRSAAS